MALVSDFPEYLRGMWSRARERLAELRAQAWSKYYRAQLILKRRTLKQGRTLAVAAAAGLVLVSILFLPLLQSLLESTLGDGTEALSDILIDLGSSLIGATAITFSLVMFAMQMALLHNSVAGARVGSWGGYLGGHEQAFSCPLPHNELA